MDDTVLKAIYLAGIVAQMVIRMPHERRRRASQSGPPKADRQERILFGLLSLGSFLLPVIYIFTSWLAFADYRLPEWAGVSGVVLLAGSLYLFWRSHRDLGLSWSPTLEIRESHALVTQGVYRRVRHPMYASQWLFVLAQPLLLQNWIAGLGGIVGFAPLYFLRVPKEEQMMIDEFGQPYRDYMERTGRLIPHRGA